MTGMLRKEITRDASGRTVERYRDLGPSRAVLGHGRQLLAVPGGGMQTRQLGSTAEGSHGRRNR